MSTNVSNVKTEYTYQAQALQGEQTTSAPNSVYTVEQPQGGSVENKQNTSKLDEMLQKLCAELAKYDLTPEKIKNSGLLLKITGMNQQQLENATDEELKQIIDCLKTAIKDSEVDGKVDLEKVGKLSKDYYVAVKTGWTIEGFKKVNKNGGESLTARMERFFGLEKGSFTKLPQAKIEEYLDRYFNEYFVEKLKAAKTPEEKQKIYKQQLQDFGKLLINTPDSEKAIFKQAITSLIASNRIKGLKAVLSSFETQKARTEWSDNWSVEDSKRLATKADVEGNTPDADEVTEGIAYLTAQKSEQGIKEHHEEFQTEAKAFFEENKDALEKIAQKEANGETLTDEEKKLKLLRDNFYTAVSAGEISGTALNEIIKEEVKLEILGTMNKDAYELPNYKNVIQEVTEFVEKHPEALTMPKEELVKILDEATNGNYSVVASGSDAELKAPAQPASEDVQTVPDYGFTQKEAVDTTRLQALQQQIVAASEDSNPKFTVEKTSASQQNDTIKLDDALRSTSKFEEYIETTGVSYSSAMKEAGKNFSKLTDPLKQRVLTFVESQKTNRINLLQSINNSQLTVAASKLFEITSDDLKKLSLASCFKEIIKKNNEQRV